jgi:regulator of nucleoside diphosphate kinase
MTAGALLSRRPQIVLCETDRAALERTALLGILEIPRTAGALLEEVDRAEVVPDEDLAPDRVRLGSFVIYRDEAVGEQVCVQLVEDGRPGGVGELSILSTDGAALVGLRVGQSILWPDRRGCERLITVLDTWRSPVVQEGGAQEGGVQDVRR